MTIRKVDSMSIAWARRIGEIRAQYDRAFWEVYSTEATGHPARAANELCRLANQLVRYSKMLRDSIEMSEDDNGN